MFGLYLERNEMIEIAISVISISLALAIVFAQIDGMTAYPKEFLLFMAPLIVTAGSGFILHEMAHKLVAIYYGAQAKFKMWTQGLIVMLIGSIVGVLFAAPGAVYIHSNNITPRQNGMISLAGPMLNLALVGFFIVLEFILPIRHFFSFLLTQGGGFEGFGIFSGVLHVWRFGAAINIMLALFNMIPAFPLDGSKVFHWNRIIWIATIAVLLGVGAIIISPGIVIGWGIMLLIFTVFSKLFFG